MENSGQTKPFVQLHTLVTTDAKTRLTTIRIGNCEHCVTRGTRPPVSLKPRYHPEGARDYTEEELQAVNQEFTRRLAALGVVTVESKFIPKDTMIRAPEPGR